MSTHIQGNQRLSRYLSAHNREVIRFPILPLNGLSEHWSCAHPPYPFTRQHMQACQGHGLLTEQNGMQAHHVMPPTCQRAVVGQLIA